TSASESGGMCSSSTSVERAPSTPESYTRSGYPTTVATVENPGKQRLIGTSAPVERELQHLGQADVVAGRVTERGVDSVRLRRRWIVELHASRRELVVRGLAVVGLEEQRAAGTLRDDL